MAVAVCKWLAGGARTIAFITADPTSAAIASATKHDLAVTWC
jgi:hypothetical protein